ncbi:MAG TPA: DUF3017 domain-containing protein [Intrasporangium sp.]|uniref:DUF3017 domain-containing protein n=1 Tax=Intrasporangium sp. TaxID=1925024 RepID=UPI002D768520|nr:DUF3017 domain-containing protein [Intrasporangium sp.]HET7399839.1 DUF3017 domain-containing protein [Intrasporangium sp.]
MRLRGSGFVVLGLWWLVAAVVGSGLLVIVAGHLRLGGQIMSGGFLLGGLIRLVRSPRGAGGLTARSRSLDVTILLLLGVGVLVASATVNLSPDDPQRIPPGRTGTR